MSLDKPIRYLVPIAAMKMTISNTAPDVTRFQPSVLRPQQGALLPHRAVPRPPVPAAGHEPSEWDLLAAGALVVLGTLAVFKLLQAIFDDEYEGRFLPQSVRDNLIGEHLERKGAWCPGWRRDPHRVAISEFTVDHIVSHKNGGKTSIANSQVLCRSCNAAKGATNSILDHVRGR